MIMKKNIYSLLVLFTYIIISVILNSSCDKEDKSESVTYNPSLDSIKFNDTIVYGELIDIDNNKYKTRKIGNQIWMVENLKVTRFNNGNSIPIISNCDEWIKQNEAACCDFNNETSDRKSVV